MRSTIVLVCSLIMVWSETPLYAGGWIHGEGANLNGIALDRLHVGFGDRLFWVFDNGADKAHVVSSIDLILGGQQTRHNPMGALEVQLDRLRTQHGLQNARFLCLWLTTAWRVDWFRPAEIQRALDHRITPVFIDWYFGDRLLQADVRKLIVNQLPAYAEHARRLGRYLGQFDGDILVVIEPELNKPAVEKWPAFGSLLRKYGIAEIRTGVAEINAATGRQTRVFFGTVLTDNGLRSADIADNVYGHKARGDSYGWTLSRDLLEELRPDLDFIGFQQLLGQFHRNPQKPDKAVKSTPDELGLTYLATRLVNYAKYLKEQLGIPIFIPYLGFATSRWDDNNNNGRVDAHEVVELGWEREIGQLFADIRVSYPALFRAGVFGLVPMMLFDDPVHNLGGYQYMLQNEYALGLVATDATDGQLGATLGQTLHPKRFKRKSYLELLFISN